ncbi:hypothetical protein BGY98DRAFT_1094919 [Russula aff. rugulosa BPL654]|nr:hypothetical protein BGY98DRAFT_1094919 [Russula aff. rugulosa BPL654]
MAFIPQPASVESLQGTEEVDAPPTPASFKAGSPTDEQRFSSFYSIDSRTGARGETITMGPPRLWHGFESPDMRHSNNTPGGTTSIIRNAPTEHTSGPRRVDSAHHNPLGNPSHPPASIYSQASVIRPGVGRKNLPVAKNRLNRSSAFPGLTHDVLSPTSLYVPASPGDHPQREQTYTDRTWKAKLSISTLHSSAASVHSMWMEPTPHKPPPPVLTPDIARFRGSSPYLGPKSASSGNNAPFATSGSNAPRTPKLTERHRTIQHYGAPQPYHPPVKESSFSRKGGHGQVLDPAQWRQLVLNAAAKP